jgi:hypothetical protein
VKFGYRVNESDAVLRFEQRGDPVDVPVTVSISYASGPTEDIVVALADQVTERIVPLKGAVRTITANTDNGALVEIEK